MKPHLFTSEEPLKLGPNIAICQSVDRVNEFIESVEGEISSHTIREIVLAIPRLCWKCRKVALLSSEEKLKEIFKRYLYVGISGKQEI